MRERGVLIRVIVVIALFLLVCPTWAASLADRVVAGEILSRSSCSEAVVEAAAFLALRLLGVCALAMGPAALLSFVTRSRGDTV